MIKFITEKKQTVGREPQLTHHIRNRFSTLFLQKEESRKPSKVVIVSKVIKYYLILDQESSWHPKKKKNMYSSIWEKVIVETSLFFCIIQLSFWWRTFGEEPFSDFFSGHFPYHPCQCLRMKWGSVDWWILATWSENRSRMNRSPVPGG